MASITVTGTQIEFTGSLGNEAVAETQLTLATPTDDVSFRFEVERNGLFLRIGSASNEMDVLNETYFAPGQHIFSIAANASPVFIQWRYKGLAKAILKDFVAAPVGDMFLTTPWAEGDLRSIRWDQSGNVMWMADGINPPQVFERRGANSWSLREFRPDNGPFAGTNFTDTTITASARTGEVTLTSSAPLFAAYDTGMLMRLTHQGQNELDTLSAVDDVTDAVRVTGVDEGRRFSVRIAGIAGDTIVLERSVGNELSWQTAETYTANGTYSINDEFENAVIYYRLRKSVNGGGTVTGELIYGAGFTDGTVRIVEVVADNQVIADVIEPLAKTTATTLWAFGAWGGRFGYPRAVALEDGRLWWFRGIQYWASASDDFENFALGTLADEALSRTMPGRMSQTQWAAGADGKLLVGLEGFEANIGTGALDEIIRPDNVRAKDRTSRGSHDHQPPVIDDHAAFISRSQNRIYRFGYNPDRADYSAFDVTRLNRDLGRYDHEARVEVKFVELSYQYEPEPRLLIVRDDGQLAGIVYSLEEQVVACYRYKIPDAQILSVCVIPGQPEDLVFLTVRRVVNGTPTVGIERLAPEYWIEVEDAWRLHSAIAYDGAETSTLSGLQHLEGEDVYLWNGRQQGPFTVTGGAITLQYPVTKAIVGKLYNGRYRSARMGQAIANWRKIGRLAFWLYRTAGASFRWGRSFDPNVMDQLKDQTYTATISEGPIPLYGDGNSDENAENLPFDGGSDRDARVHILMDTAGPCTILALGPEVDVSAR